MNATESATLLEPGQLSASLDQDGLVIVDVSSHQSYARWRIPGALHIDYPQLVSVRPPVGGLLPDTKQFVLAMQRLGIDYQQRVVAYDDEANGRASRLLWTLRAYGHRNNALLNGGLHSWMQESRPCDPYIAQARPSSTQLQYSGDGVADRSYIIQNLGNQDVVIIDARSPAEYSGSDLRAARGGHIPAAINLEWTMFIDQQRSMRLKQRASLMELLTQHGATPDKEIICYCQTHHRSALTCQALHSLGYTRVKGYPGSWSEWGNRSDTPIEAP